MLSRFLSTLAAIVAVAGGSYLLIMSTTRGNGVLVVPALLGWAVAGIVLYETFSDEAR